MSQWVLFLQQISILSVWWQRVKIFCFQPTCFMLNILFNVTYIYLHMTINRENFLKKFCIEASASWLQNILWFISKTKYYLKCILVYLQFLHSPNQEDPFIPLCSFLQELLSHVSLSVKDRAKLFGMLPSIPNLLINWQHSKLCVSCENLEFSASLPDLIHYAKNIKNYIL